jgi:hypothetical protein
MLIPPRRTIPAPRALGAQLFDEKRLARLDESACQTRERKVEQKNSPGAHPLGKTSTPGQSINTTWEMDTSMKKGCLTTALEVELSQNLRNAAWKKRIHSTSFTLTRVGARSPQ